ncbi:efflux RND transporter permease subunit, partial [Bosea sp. MMO-172]|uniref:efflux RND transporter permease subunit n=1 Tax=Bosea sp. MMO-172 TaxID=3127885 RepID=UPI003018F1B3
WNTGTGSEVMRRIAVPMIGGMVSSAVLTLLVIPAIYGLIKGWRLPQGALPSPAVPLPAQAGASHTRPVPGSDAVSI